MRTLRRAAIALGAFVLAGTTLTVGDAAASPRVLHAAPSGSGTVCSAGRPCSIEQAKATVRHEAPRMHADLVVRLSDGPYQPLELGPEDSGRNGYTVHWQAEPGAHPVFDGSTPVAGWHPHDGRIWEADVAKGATAREIYVDGVRAVRARGLGCAATACKASATAVTGLDPKIAAFARPADLRLVTTSRWRDFHCGITAVAGGTATMAQPCWDNANARTQTGWESASPLGRWQGVDYVENAYELLGTPGQFYLDSRAGKLYYVPRGGEDMTTAHVAIPVAEHLLTVAGTLDDPVHDIAFEGLGFTGAAWRNPDSAEGYAGAQAGYYVSGTRTGTISGAGEDYARTPAAVTVTAGERIRFTGGTVHGLGGAGLALSGGTKDSVVEDTTFTDLSGGAVFVGDSEHAPADPRAKAAGNVVRRNTISHIGVEFRDAVGITGMYDNGLTIDHNTVHDVPYTAISVGWGWNFVGEAPTQRDVLVSHNKIYRHMQVLYDGGAIYTQAVSPGSRVEGNDIDFSGTDHGNGIYHDEKSSYYTTTGNVVRGTAHVAREFNWISAWASWSTHLIIRSNWTDAPESAPHNPGATKLWGPNTFGVTQWPAAAQHVIDTAGAVGSEPRDVRFTQPAKSVWDGATDVEVAAPFDTRAVRFSMDGTAFAEVTRWYANGTGLAPTWRTATDASWFPAGDHVLRADAITGQGVVSATMAVRTQRAPDPSGTMNLNGAWQFATAAELPPGALDGAGPPAVAPGYDESATTPVLVPDSYGAVRDRWNDDNGQAVLYRKQFDLGGAQQGERTSLVFDSCYFACTYYLNGAKVGSSVGGNLPERFDVTGAARPGRNTVAVVADNRTSTIRPYGINTDLYWNWGGLTQGVRIERTPALALTAITAEGAADGTLTLRADKAGTGSVPATVTVTAPDGSRALSTPVRFTGDPVTVHVPNVKLWSPEQPAVYGVRVQVPHRPDLTTSTGFRTVEAHGADILLNGRVLRDLRGFNRHADYPGLGRTQPDGLAARELKTMRDRGFTLMRPAHYPTTPAELDAADRLGILVMEEVPVTQANATQLASQRTRDYAADRLAKMVGRDRGHPAIFAWSVGNENATNTQQGADYVRDLTTLSRRLDPDRLTTHVSAWFTSDKAYAFDDFVAVNRYDGWYYGSAEDIGKDMDTLQAFAGAKPMVLSEYGAEAVKDRPGTGMGTEYYQAQMIDTYNRQLENRPHFLGQMYWTSTEFALTPDGGGGDPIPVPGFHNKALLTYDRQQKLAWQVIVSPVRIRTLPPVAGAPATLDIVLDSVSGRAARGTVLVAPPAGFQVDQASVPFQVPAGGSTTVHIRLTGSSPTPANPGTGQVRAVVDGQTQALPAPISLVPRQPAPR
ncbi:glycoside hydrolase family 2 TIM barrel-domain containing protein [Amycolatopsis nivea]